MGAVETISAVRAAGITLMPEGDGIRASPRSALNDSLRASIRANRRAILAILRGGADDYAREERAAIYEFDAGLTREDAEMLAGVQ